MVISQSRGPDPTTPYANIHIGVAYPWLLHNQLVVPDQGLCVWLGLWVVSEESATDDDTITE